MVEINIKCNKTINNVSNALNTFDIVKINHVLSRRY